VKEESEVVIGLIPGLVFDCEVMFLFAKLARV
jgi:hypothetical protein